MSSEDLLDAWLRNDPPPGRRPVDSRPRSPVALILLVRILLALLAVRIGVDAILLVLDEILLLVPDVGLRGEFKGRTCAED